MPEHFGGQEPPVAVSAQFPGAIRLAGWHSMISAIVLLLNAAVSLLLSVGMFAWDGPEVACFTVPLNFLTGLACFIGSLMILWGKVQNTAVHGINSIICGLLNIGFGTLVIGGLLQTELDSYHRFLGVEFYYHHLSSRNLALFVESVSLAAGVGLVTGGALAWRGNQEYQRWREPPAPVRGTPPEDTNPQSANSSARTAIDDKQSCYLCGKQLKGEELKSRVCRACQSEEKQRDAARSV
jgi:hypothetical protein